MFCSLLLLSWTAVLKYCPKTTFERCTVSVHQECPILSAMGQCGCRFSFQINRSSSDSTSLINGSAFKQLIMWSPALLEWKSVAMLALYGEDWTPLVYLIRWIMGGGSRQVWLINTSISICLITWSQSLNNWWVELLLCWNKILKPHHLCITDP